jgi:hypothetical protein
MGRPKGAKNKHTFQVEEIAHKFDVEPFEIMMRIAVGDWKFFGFDGATKITYTMNGIEVEELNIPMKERAQMAKEASKYLYSAKQAIEVTGEMGIKVIVEDYLNKEEG